MNDARREPPLDASERLRARAEAVIPGGGSTESKRPAVLFGAEGGPAGFAAAEGAELLDVDGHRVVDFGMALGTCLLGYDHPVVVDAVRAALGTGTVTSLPSPLEVEVAERIVSLYPSIEKLRFLKSGAEACSAAVRLARAYTGRDHVLGCGYFGWHDWCQFGAGVPAAVRALYHPFAFNDVEDFARRLAAVPETPAAVILEPVVREAPAQAFLHAIREACDRLGMVFVLDEVKTGARLAPGGAQHCYDIRPELTVLGKAVAGGLPLAVVGGRREILDAGDRVWISSTLAGETLALAATRAVLAFIREEPVCAHLAAMGARLLAGFEALESAFPDRVTSFGIPQMNGLALSAAATDARFRLALYRRGFLLKRGGYDFVSYAHTDRQVDACLQACREVIEGVEAGEE